MGGFIKTGRRHGNHLSLSPLGQSAARSVCCDRNLFAVLLLQTHTRVPPPKSRLSDQIIRGRYRIEIPAALITSDLLPLYKYPPFPPLPRRVLLFFFFFVLSSFPPSFPSTPSIQLISQLLFSTLFSYSTNFCTPWICLPKLLRRSPVPAARPRLARLLLRRRKRVRRPPPLPLARRRSVERPGRRRTLPTSTRVSDFGDAVLDAFS